MEPRPRLPIPNEKPNGADNSAGDASVGKGTGPLSQADLDTSRAVQRKLGAQPEPRDAQNRRVTPPATDDPPQAANDSAERQALGANPQHEARPAEHSGISDAALLGLEELGQYKLLGKLGEGGMGAVYKALHTRLNKLVALKVLPACRMQDAEAVARFEREMRAVGTLAHPHIVAAHDAGEIGGTHYLVMELVDGLDLGTTLKRVGKLALADACEIIRQAALGLQHVHESGLVHRDIKPSNLMLASSPEGVHVKILDLGLALLDDNHAAADELTGSGQIMGTIDYMAPEQAGNTHSVDHRADIYALGASLHKLLTGHVPFHGPQFTSTVRKLLALATQAPPPIDTLRADLPPQLVEVIQRMLAREPEARYGTPREVAEALAPFTAGANLKGLLQAATREQSAANRAVAQSPHSINQPGSDQADLPNAWEEGIAAARGGQFDEGARDKSPPPPVAATGASPPWYRRKTALAGAAAMPLLLVLLGAVLFMARTPQGEVVVELADGIPAEAAKDIKIELAGSGELKVADAQAGWAIDVAEGTYRVQLAGGDDRFQLNRSQLTVTRDERAFLRVSLKPPGPAAKADDEEPSRSGQAPPPDGVRPVVSSKQQPWKPSPEQQAFLERVAALSAEEQAKAVAEKLKEANPGFDGEYQCTIGTDAVQTFALVSDHVRDIWPIRALVHLQQLRCEGASHSSLEDLSPLAGLKLQVVGIARTDVADLSPLRGMPLEVLYLQHCRKVWDISPLKDMPLKNVNISYCNQITDFSPLEGKPLISFHCSGTNFSDLGILAPESMTSMEIERTRVTDLSPLKDMPLRTFNCFGAPINDYSVLRGKSISLLGITPRLFDDEFDAILRSLPLKRMTQLGRNWPEMSIEEYWSTLETKRKAAENFVQQAALLQGVRRISPVQARLAELNGVANAKLNYSVIAYTIDNLTLMLREHESWDISPIMAFPEVRAIRIQGGHVSQDLSCLKFIALKHLSCPEGMVFTNRDILRSIPTLETINSLPAPEFIDSAAPE